MTMVTIDGVAHEVRLGAKVSSLYRRDPMLPFGCLAGRCGTCLVRVTEGAFGPMGPVERQYLSAHRLSLTGDLRLLCQAMVLGSAVIETVSHGANSMAPNGAEAADRTRGDVGSSKAAVSR